jgi:hypothetical protein
MTLAAIDRLVHHSTVVKMNVDSYRRKAAIEKARGAGRPATCAAITRILRLFDSALDAGKQ